MLTRREFLKLGGASAAAAAISARSGFWRRVLAVPAAAGLSDPALQPKFAYPVPDALSPAFRYRPRGRRRTYRVGVGQSVQQTGLVDANGTLLNTTVFGYGDKARGYTWPGKTFEVKSGQPTTVQWENALLGPSGAPLTHLLPVDTSLHWCYALPGYYDYSIPDNGIPIIAHLHGGHSDFQFDGNPEFFYGPPVPGVGQVVGPQWNNIPGGFTNQFTYHNDQPAGNLWYHDHALGITRLNVYAGLAGFYFIRDQFDTGKASNPLGLPAWPYEKAYAIQDRMFQDTGELFYSAFPGDPFYDDFITGEGAILPPEQFPDGGPTALAEFFGDHMVVNGVIWPKEEVEPRHYRLRLLNGTDSRFMRLRFRIAASPTATDLNGASDPVPFWVIGSDQGLAQAATQTASLLSEPGGRYDVVFDFSDPALAGKRIIMENILGDAPYGGELPEPGDLFPNRQTDRVMAFDVVLPLDPTVPDVFDPANIASYGGNTVTPARTRRVALFEGLDEYGRLQPLLGTAELEMDAAGAMVNGAIAWHSPTTENPGLDTTEIWEIYNATGDAHPVHLHLVNFEIMNREGFTAAVIEQPILQHNGEFGIGFRLENIALDGNVEDATGVEKAPKDMVTALPGEVTRIKATFDKPGRYVWHCHILSHEDHEMMRVLHVGPGA